MSSAVKKYLDDYEKIIIEEHGEHLNKQAKAVVRLVFQEVVTVGQRLAAMVDEGNIIVGGSDEHQR